MFIFAIVCLFLALIGFAAFFMTREERTNKRVPSIAMGAFAFLFGSAVFTMLSVTYTVDTGSSAVLKDFTGVVQEEAITTPGLHFKLPWQDDISWDVKNQDVTFSGNGTTTHNDQKVTGAEITIIDKDGIAANLDIQVLFSIKADQIVALTKGYTNQADFELKVVENDIKSIPRDVASGFTTVQMFEDRTGLKTKIVEELKKAWADKGVVVDNVNIHGIRYPDDVQQRFKDAQNAQTDLLKAQTDAETAKTKAEGEADAAIAKAKGEAEANKLVADSLTPTILQMRWIEALSAADLIVVPDNFTGLGSIAGQPKTQ